MGVCRLFMFDDGEQTSTSVSEGPTVPTTMTDSAGMIQWAWPGDHTDGSIDLYDVPDLVVVDGGGGSGSSEVVVGTTAHDPGKYKDLRPTGGDPASARFWQRSATIRFGEDRGGLKVVDPGAQQQARTKHPAPSLEDRDRGDPSAARASDASV